MNNRITEIHDTEQLPQQIRDNIKHFDLPALLILLQHLNYKQIWFSGSDSLVSQERLIQGIEFKQQRVIITVNLGLLGPQSALPTYMMRMRETLIDKDEEFKQFIGFFDHTLIFNTVKNSYPQLNLDYFSQWEQEDEQGVGQSVGQGVNNTHYAKTWLWLTTLKAKRSLHAVFAALFPECKVVCDAHKPLQCLPLQKTRLGKIALGTPYQLGDIAFTPASRVVVFLDNAAHQLPLSVLKKRLHQEVLPLFAPLKLMLDVKIVGVIDPLKTAVNKPLGISSFISKSEHKHKDKLRHNLTTSPDVKSKSQSGMRSSTECNTPLGYHPMLTKPTQGWALLFSGQTYQPESYCEG